MKSRALIMIPILLLGLATALGQDSRFFRTKLGKPSELYRHKSGVNVLVDYDEKGQVCSIDLTDPTRQTAPHDSSVNRLMAVAGEVVPLIMRGRKLATALNIGNCTDQLYEDYERALIEINRNACYEQWIKIHFKRASCPKPPVVTDLQPVVK